MSSAPPSRSLPNLEWLRKAAKSRLRVLREQRPEARLADAQLLLAREHGFPSWRALKAAVDAALAEQPPRRYRVDAADEVSEPWLKLVALGDVDRVSAALDRVPHLVHVLGPHPYWGGRPQALHVAVERRDREMFELLLARGADPSGRNDEYDEWSPLMLAANREHPEMMRALLKYGAHIGLYEALLMGDDRQLRRLIANGAEALAGSVPNSGSPLMFARTPFAIRRVVELGAPLDRADRWGKTPIQAMSALGKSGAPLVTLMASLGAEASPAVRARIGDLDQLKRLAATNVDAVVSDAVLAAAVENGDAEMVRWLLDSGANANAHVGGDADRRSVLHNAAWNGSLDLVRILVERGADVSMRDAEHHSTPLDWARTAIEVTRNPACAEVARFLGD